MYDSHKFDYGSGNVYGTFSPPLFPLDNFPSQIHLSIFEGLTDGYIRVPNIVRLQNEIDPTHSHSTLTQLQYNGAFNHLDFLFSTQAGSLLYQPSLDYLDDYY